MNVLKLKGVLIMNDNSILAGFLALGMIFIFIAIIVVVLYVLLALGLSTLAKNNGYEDKAILAWIPFANLYLLGLMSGDARIFNSFDLKADVVGILLAVGPLVTAIPIIGFIVSIAIFIIAIYAYYNLFSKIDQSNATLMTILSMLIGFVGPIYIFLKRDAIFTDDNYRVY